ncbi:GmrSD restriction endonuclease domain-containing protein [Arthrobacter sp. A5]|uniref:GmrSD restriction endonuclease domain-containing protein n=1 Tax=Arthrobacter sp. A5 TaxID=576926 RepID=UPI003DA80CF0
MDPLDPDTVPVVTLSGVASPKAQPAYGTKALDLLAALPVKGRAPKTGYGRTEFGQAWADVDRNGCDTRNDILKRDLTAIAFKAGTGDCLVLTGSLHDPYTATAIAFTRGTSTSSAVQIDHVVALSDAWQKGAQQLTLAQRTALANDPLNLLAVDGPTNQKKSDGDAATWLPPVKAYRCDYVARQISVKATYGLWVTQAEHDAMSTILGDCAGALAPTDQPDPVQPAPVQPPAPVIAQAPVQEAAPVQPAVPAPGAQPAPGPAYYANCTAVRAAGAAPIRAGQPGYRVGLDRDGDGIGCE